MPPKKESTPQPKLREPYERHSYGDLRHELSVRRIRLPRSNSDRLSNRGGFIKLLRNWDDGAAPPPAKRARTQTSNKNQKKRTQKANKNQTPMNSTRVVRARRGCRFRLINVLLSPDFNGRWGEMVTRGGKMDVNRLWLDVHAAFMAQNSMLDTLHFQDALFVNVTPDVILGHSAARLLQMWIEIVAMYRNAVAQAKNAATRRANAHSFFDFCAGRLDLLYLHMAMLLEPKLYGIIMSDKLRAAETINRTKPKASASFTPATENKKAPAKHQAKTAGKMKASAAVAKAATASAPSKATLAAVPAASTELEMKAPVVSVKSSKLPTQNPEMKEPVIFAQTKSTATTALPKTTAAKAKLMVAKAKQTKPAASPIKPVGQKKPQKAVGKVKATTTTVSAKETKPKASPSKPKQTTPPPKPKVDVKTSQIKPPADKTPTQTAQTSQKKSPVDDKPTQTTSCGKRPREDDTAIVEIPSVSDIVPHPGKRVHTTTTTISTALATRSADVVLPPDEWDILESRLRKVNENIDRCHLGLASVEGNVSDGYKQSLEADLRFYSAIKQRLQEQLLVVMQSGY